MSEPKWTKGPWRYRPLNNDDWGTVRSSEEEWPRIVARCVHLPHASPIDVEATYNEARQRKIDPYEANARLIAAAPEEDAALLAAPDIRALTPEAFFAEYCKWYDGVRTAVLAKARGER